MSLKKVIKKSISRLLPKGVFKEQLKVIWYNIISNKKVHYKINKMDKKSLIYETTFKDLIFFTNEPLYTITPDFDNYQHFYSSKDGDIIIDGGANIGALSLLFSKKVGSNGHVFCFEPDRYNITKLISNFALNTNHFDNYSIHEELIWSSDSLVDFQESGTVASSALWFSNEENIVKKQAMTLDHWCELNAIKHIDFIKMDIEGAELEAVEGCMDIIRKFRPNFAIASYHMVNGEPTYIKLETFFKTIGFPVKTKKFSGYEVITFAGPCVEEV